MGQPHKHADIIKAWADGAQVQCRGTCDTTWKDIGEQPCWFDTLEYRIKPAPRPDVVYYGVFDMDYKTNIDACFTKFHDIGDQIKLTFDGETGKLKSAEVL